MLVFVVYIEDGKYEHYIAMEVIEGKYDFNWRLP